MSSSPRQHSRAAGNKFFLINFWICDYFACCMVMLDRYLSFCVLIVQVYVLQKNESSEDNLKKCIFKMIKQETSGERRAR